MRLFVALIPPAGVLAELETVVAPLRQDWPGLRWTSQDCWHVTLAFLGDVDEAKLAPLAVRLERAAGRHRCQMASLNGAGAFPSAGKARVLWAGVLGDRSALAALASSVAAGARRAGAPSPDERKSFHPHLTLARTRASADVGPLIDALGGFTGSAWTAYQVHLVSSVLRQRPHYTTVGSWPLRPA